ncbi:MAG: hypothetical protein ACTSVY_06805 [Candidatus Helarchaeota archaeon]
MVVPHRSKNVIFPLFQERASNEDLKVGVRPSASMMIKSMKKRISNSKGHQLKMLGNLEKNQS